MVNLKGFIPMDSKKRNFDFGKRSSFEKQYRMDKRLSRIEKWDYFPSLFFSIELIAPILTLYPL